jgi:hypothetical protein
VCFSLTYIYPLTSVVHNKIGGRSERLLLSLPLRNREERGRMMIEGKSGKGRKKETGREKVLRE